MAYQLAVIGAGPGGYEAAIRAAQLGMSTALIEQRELGGTCLNRGCIPTKALLHTANLYAAAREGARFGVCAGEVTLDETAMFARKDEVVEGLKSGIAQLIRSNRIDLYESKGCIEAPGRVRVGDRIIEAERVLIATGSVPALPPIEGMEHCITSDDLLCAQSLPESLVIIGGGVIGVEFASMYAALGRQITVIEAQGRLLPLLDREFGQSVSMNLKKAGAQVHTDALVKRVLREGERVRVEFEVRGKAAECAAQAALVATGRRANTQGLFANGFDLQMHKGCIVVDDHFETSVPGVYAIGDVTGGIQLAHAASAQGIACVEGMAGMSSGMRLDLIPSCVYTEPEMASVGLTADEAKARGIAVRSAKVLMGANGRTQIAGGARGWIKVVVDAQTDVLLGAQMMGERATDLIGEMNLAIANGLTRRQMLCAVRAHPTFEEAITESLEAVEGRAIHAAVTRK